MIQLLKRIFYIFSHESKLNFVLLFLNIILNSILELVGIGLILPFLSLLARPELLQKNTYLSAAYQFFAFQSFTQFMIALAGGIIGIFILKNALLILIAFWQSRFLMENRTYLASRLFKAFLLSPFSYHLRRNLGQFQQRLSTVGTITQGIILQVYTIMTEAVLLACLFSVLCLANFWLTIVATAVLSGGLSIYFLIVRNKLRRWGEINNRHIALLNQQINQGLGSIKESKLLGKEQFFVDRYRNLAHLIGLQQNKSEVLTKGQRLYIETIIVGLVMMVMIFCLLAGQAPDSLLLTISLFALVAVRLMPSLNRISASWSLIKFTLPGFNDVYSDLVECERMEKEFRERVTGAPLSFSSTIEAEDVVFFYEGAKTPALDHVTLCIPKNSTVGFVGPSGAGKTTMIDIILGLLELSSGKIKVDGVDIYTNLRSWQKKIGYIPQVIYLCDDTIRNNVAFGVEPHEIREEKVQEALRLAQLEDFVRSLPQGLETRIGERGVRLSGGQRQRIGIARTLYNDPEVLVMDEATAALDNETERDFMGALTRLSCEKTILIIAHRLTTVQQCDKIFFLKDGRLVDEGTHAQLLECSQEFQKMAGVGHF